MRHVPREGLPHPRFGWSHHWLSRRDRSVVVPLLQLDRLSLAPQVRARATADTGPAFLPYAPPCVCTRSGYMLSCQVCDLTISWAITLSCKRLGQGTRPRVGRIVEEQVEVSDIRNQAIEDGFSLNSGVGRFVSIGASRDGATEPLVGDIVRQCFIEILCGDDRPDRPSSGFGHAQSSH